MRIQKNFTIFINEEAALELMKDNNTALIANKIK